MSRLQLCIASGGETGVPRCQRQCGAPAPSPPAFANAFSPRDTRRKRAIQRVSPRELLVAGENRWCCSPSKNWTARRPNDSTVKRKQRQARTKTTTELGARKTFSIAEVDDGTATKVRNYFSTIPCPLNRGGNPIDPRRDFFHFSIRPVNLDLVDFRRGPKAEMYTRIGAG